jgi:hypothetical protein
MRITSLLLNQARAYENIISSYEGSNDKGSHIITKFFPEITRCLVARLFVGNWFIQSDGHTMMMMMMMLMTIIIIIIIII